MSRYLTPQEKEDTVKFWLMTREAQAPTTPLAEEHIVMGGFDWPDPPIFPYTDLLNAIEGVCTISSCMGHRLEYVAANGHPQPDLYYDGHLWFRLSADNTKTFEKHAIELARMPNVTAFRKNYNLARSTKFWEWYEVEFRGGEPTLEESVLPIIGFFEEHFSHEVLHPMSEGEAADQPDLMRPLPSADTEAARAET